MAFAAFEVQILESERGWGSRIDDSIYFIDEETAKKWKTDYNTEHNPPGPAPEWYMIALEPQLIQITEKQHKALKKKGKLWAEELVKIK